MIDLTEFAKQSEERATPVSRSSELHGPRHWRDVARVALALMQEHPPGPNDDLDVELVFMFAALHDTQRLNEDYDPEHGARAAEFTQENLDKADLDADRLDLLCRALTRHDAGRTHWNATIGLCWDADRLLLRRVGIDPDEEFFSIPFVKAELAHYVAIADDIWTGEDQTWKEIALGYENIDWNS